jgi:hypothetical protein
MNNSGAPVSGGLQTAEPKTTAISNRRSLMPAIEIIFLKWR